MNRIAIIGAGPIGLETALECRRRGLPVTVYEAGTVGEHFRRYGPMRLFTPFRMNASLWGRSRLAETGVSLPGDEEILTGEALRERYLIPLSRLPELRESVREGERVLGVAREGIRKPHAGVAGGRSRAAAPFLLRIESAARGPRFDRADVVVDASGVYGTPNATGPGGLPALGEEALGARVERHVPDLNGSGRGRYAGLRTLLVGDGRSAATAIRDFDTLVSAGAPGSRTRVEWIHRDRGGEAFAPIPGESLRSLPELGALHERACSIAREAPWLARHTGATVLEYRTSLSGGVEVSIAEADGTRRALEVDRVLALVGYGPDVSLFRELQIHLCYASEGPMALSAAILAAETEDPASSGDCLAQSAHGPASLKSPEPNFYILGAKSYGRNPNFLLSLGHRQLADALDLISEPALAGGASP